MKNVFALALICYVAFWGAVAEPVSASESSPRPVLSNKAFPAHVLLAKKGTSTGRTTSTLTLNNVRHHAHKQYTRVVFDLTGRVKIKERKNQRIATISLPNVTLSKGVQQQIKRKDFPRAIALSPEKPRTVSIVLDLQTLRTYRVLTLRQPDRVVVDLFYAKKTPAVVARPETGTSKPSKPARQGDSRVGQANLPAAKPPKGVLVVIDPGHGGRDPGTTGRKGTKEKTIVLQVSKYLRDLIQQRHKAKVLLTRSKDVFLTLEERVKFANQKKLEWCGKDMRSKVHVTKKCLFVSIHVNSHPQRSVHGLEIYHLGEASDRRALEVAARENGMKLEDSAPPWQFIIADTDNDQNNKKSMDFAWITRNSLLTTFHKNYKIKVPNPKCARFHCVKKAPFYVLRFTTMPSILAEVGFVSNSMEEKRLKTTTFQKKLAEGIYQGIQAYLKKL